MVNFRQNVHDAGVQTEVDQPLVFGVVSEMDDIEWRNFGRFQLNVKIARYVKCVRLVVRMMTFVAIVFLRLLNAFWHACGRK